MTPPAQHDPVVRRVAVVTGSRSDFSHLRPVIAAIERHPRLEAAALVSGSHLSAVHGATLAEVTAAGIRPAARVECLPAEDTDAAVAAAMGRAVGGFAEAFAALQPDWVLVLGDRYEIFAAATAATAMRIPLAHVGGGECEAASNIDFALRNAITQMAAVHFVSCGRYGDRVAALGQRRWRIHVVGSPALDGIADGLLDPDALGGELGVDFRRPVLLATVLPVTLRPAEHRRVTEALLAAIERQADLQVIFTGVNADAGGGWIRDRLARFAAGRRGVAVVASLGGLRYRSAMAAAAAVAGNSSSGLIETPSFGVPAINIGTRQDGRVRAGNVIDVPPEPNAVADALDRALHDEDLRRRCRRVSNPLGDGRAGERIAAVLAEIEMGERLLSKTLAGAPNGKPASVEADGNERPL
jgi:UDP-hydrolysing UDP-N-acetyl-D-glucosamine 2-epimerase